MFTNKFMFNCVNLYVTFVWLDFKFVIFPKRILKYFCVYNDD